jgi:multicomponent Na+:H+ antiporter subunit F
MMQTYWTIVLGCLIAVLMAMLFMMFRKKYFLNKLNYVFGMNTVIVMLILTVGFIDGRMDMYLDIALSYSILGFVTQVILAKYIGGRRR